MIIYIFYWNIFFHRSFGRHEVAPTKPPQNQRFSAILQDPPSLSPLIQKKEKIRI